MAASKKKEQPSAALLPARFFRSSAAPKPREGRSGRGADRQGASPMPLDSVQTGFASKTQAGLETFALSQPRLALCFLPQRPIANPTNPSPLLSCAATDHGFSRPVFAAGASPPSLTSRDPYQLCTGRSASQSNRRFRPSPQPDLICAAAAIACAVEDIITNSHPVETHTV